MPTYTEMLDRLEHKIAVDGLTAHDPELATIGELLVRTGILPTIAGILADPNQPEPARLRALARAMQALRAADAAPVVTRDFAPRPDRRSPGRSAPRRSWGRPPRPLRRAG